MYIFVNLKLSYRRNLCSPHFFPLSQNSLLGVWAEIPAMCCWLRLSCEEAWHSSWHEHCYKKEITWGPCILNWFPSRDTTSTPHTLVCFVTQENLQSPSVCLCLFILFSGEYVAASLIVISYVNKIHSYCSTWHRSLALEWRYSFYHI